MIQKSEIPKRKVTQNDCRAESASITCRAMCVAYAFEHLDQSSISSVEVNALKRCHHHQLERGEKLQQNAWAHTFHARTFSFLEFERQAITIVRAPADAQRPTHTTSAWKGKI